MSFRYKSKTQKKINRTSSDLMDEKIHNNDNNNNNNNIYIYIYIVCVGVGVGAGILKAWYSAAFI